MMASHAEKSSRSKTTVPARRDEPTADQCVAIVFAVILLGSIRIVSASMTFNHTSDEPAHIACGMQWLDQGLYQYEHQHPPLTRILAALWNSDILLGCPVSRLECGTDQPVAESGQISSDRGERVTSSILPYYASPNNKTTLAVFQDSFNNRLVRRYRQDGAGNRPFVEYLQAQLVNRTAILGH
jgi:hypothetical protein